MPQALAIKSGSRSARLRFRRAKPSMRLQMRLPDGRGPGSERAFIRLDGEHEEIDQMTADHRRASADIASKRAGIRRSMSVNRPPAPFFASNCTLQKRSGARCGRRALWRRF